jgi:aspartyl-tRNA(Asn)/glutamyl-tRNA(Gln) amidotransferase subunit A
MYKADVFTIPANLAGIPAISIPAGTDSQGLPIGLQLMGPRFGDAGLLSTAGALFEALGGQA